MCSFGDLLFFVAICRSDFVFGVFMAFLVDIVQKVGILAICFSDLCEINFFVVVFVFFLLCLVLFSHALVGRDLGFVV